MSPTRRDLLSLTPSAALAALARPGRSGTHAEGTSHPNDSAAASGLLVFVGGGNTNSAQISVRSCGDGTSELVLEPIGDESGAAVRVALGSRQTAALLAIAGDCGSS